MQTPILKPQWDTKMRSRGVLTLTEPVECNLSTLRKCRSAEHLDIPSITAVINHSGTSPDLTKKETV